MKTITITSKTSHYPRDREVCLNSYLKSFLKQKRCQLIPLNDIKGDLNCKEKFWSNYKLLHETIYILYTRSCDFSLQKIYSLMLLWFLTFCWRMNLYVENNTAKSFLCQISQWHKLTDSLFRTIVIIYRSYIHL